jgi:hypothetical protein
MYFINPSHYPVYLCVYSPITARQRLSKNFTAATNTHAETEILLYASFSMRLVLPMASCFYHNFRKCK